MAPNLQPLNDNLLGLSGASGSLLFERPLARRFRTSLHARRARNAINIAVVVWMMYMVVDLVEEGRRGTAETLLRYHIIDGRGERRNKAIRRTHPESDHADDGILDLG